MRLYRIAHHDHISDLGGMGGSFHSGARWNDAGVPAVYFAESAAVAMLEMANYLPSPRLVPDTYRLGVFEIPDGTVVERWSVWELPSDWRDYPYPRSTQRRGTDWLLRGRAPLLAIPSAAVPTGLENIVLASPTRLHRTSIHLRKTLEGLYNPRAFATVGSDPRTADA